MDTTTQNAHAIIDDMVTLRIQLAAIAGGEETEAEDLGTGDFSLGGMKDLVGVGRCWTVRG